MGCSDCKIELGKIPKSSQMIVTSYPIRDTRALELHLSNVGLDIGSMYVTPVAKCRVENKYKKSELKACYDKYLKMEMEKVSPKYVLLIGAQATEALTGSKITQVHGTIVNSGGIKYVPTYSPEIIGRDPGKRGEVYAAIKVFERLCSGKENSIPKLNLRIVKSLKEVDFAFRKLGPVVSYDIETTGLDRFSDEINLIGFGDDKHQFMLPLGTKYSPLANRGQESKKQLARYIIKKLNSKDIAERVASNGKFDDLFLMHHLGTKPKLDFDLVLASHILNENTPNGLKQNAILELGAHNWDVDIDLKVGKVKSRKKYNEYLKYLGYDIYYSYKLWGVFKDRIYEDDSLRKLYYHLYMPGIRAYEDVEEHGCYVNLKQFKEVEKHLKDKLSGIEKELIKYGGIINFGSTQQLGNLLYKKLKLPILEETPAGNPSTGESTLLRLRDKHPIVPLILEYRETKIQITHFIDGWKKRMVDGRLYPNFKLHGTVTGRTSCTNPNLQQVPRNPIIRNLISAPPGYSIVEVDFSQAELRIAALMSKDPEMMKIYQSGGDIHTSTYEGVMGEPISKDPKTKKEQRKKAKAVNFGFLYGMGWKKFMGYARDKYEVNFTKKEAQEIRANFFATYRNLPHWHNRQRRLVNSQGEVRSLIGRVRRLPDIYSSDLGKRAEAERQSINSPVQGLGSDLTILSMVEVLGYAKYSNKDKLSRDNFYSIGTIHDATLYVVKNHYLKEFLPRIKYLTESPVSLRKVYRFNPEIPIVADVAVGPSWGTSYEIDFSDNHWIKKVEEFLGFTL